MWDELAEKLGVDGSNVELHSGMQQANNHPKAKQYQEEFQEAKARWVTANSALNHAAQMRPIEQVGRKVNSDEKLIQDWESTMGESTALLEALLNLKLFGVETQSEALRKAHSPNKRRWLLLFLKTKQKRVSSVDGDNQPGTPFCSRARSTLGSPSTLPAADEAPEQRAKVIIVRFRGPCTQTKPLEVSKLIADLAECILDGQQRHDVPQADQLSKLSTPQVFSFSELCRLDRPWAIVDRSAHNFAKPQLVLPIGDALREPFWVEASGLQKGLHSSLNAIHVANCWSALDVVASADPVGEPFGGFACTSGEPLSVLSDCSRLMKLLSDADSYKAVGEVALTLPDPYARYKADVLQQVR